MSKNHPQLVGELLAREWPELRNCDPELVALLPRVDPGRDREIAAERVRMSAQDRAKRLERLVALALDLGVPKKHARRVLGNQVERWPAIAAVRDVGTGIVVLAGDGEVGKTTAAVLWLLADIERGGEPPRFVHAKSSLPRPFDSDAWAQLAVAPRLVVDDLGTEFLDRQGLVTGCLDGLIDARYANERGTVITTNATGDEFKARYGARVYRRILETGGWRTVVAPVSTASSTTRSG